VTSVNDVNLHPTKFRKSVAAAILSMGIAVTLNAAAANNVAQKNNQVHRPVCLPETSEIVALARNQLELISKISERFCYVGITSNGEFKVVHLREFDRTREPSPRIWTVG
jgi:hypothetical protein